MAPNDIGLQGAYPPKMVTRIGPKAPRRHFLKKWREKRGLTQEQLAERLATYKGQISNWENHRRDITGNVQAALEEVLDLDAGQLFRDPGQPSADELLRGQPLEVRLQAVEVVRALVGKR